ncbi:hypothetical protein D3C75_1185170 [compost metagenome]
MPVLQTKIAEFEIRSIPVVDPVTDIQSPTVSISVKNLTANHRQTGPSGLAGCSRS